MKIKLMVVVQIAFVLIAVCCISLILYFVFAYKSIADYLAEANQAINTGDLNTATSILEGIVARDVSNEEAHRKLAVIYEQKGQPGMAVYHWRNIARLNPLDRDVVLKIAENLIACRRYEEAARLLKPYYTEKNISMPEKICLTKAYLYGGQSKNAAPLIEEILTIEPANPTALLLKSNLLAGNHQYKAAAAILNRINTDDPGIRSAVLIGFGNCENAAGHHKKAEYYYLQAVKVERGAIGPRFILASFYRDAGKLDKAAELYWEILNRTPGNIEAILPLAEICAAKSDSQAVERLLKEITADNKVAIASKNYIRAMLAFIRKDYPETAKLLKWSEIYGKRPAYQWIRFQASLQTKDYAAIADAARQLLKNKDTAAARKVLADALGASAEQAINQGNYVNAEELMHEIEFFAPSSSVNVRLQMLNRYRQGEYFEALKQAAALLETNPASLEALEIQGRIFLALNEPNKALESFKRLIKYRSDSPVGYFLLANAWRQAGNLAQAQKNIADARKMAPESSEIAEFMFSLYLDVKNYAGAENIADSMKQSGNRQNAALGWQLMGNLCLAKNDPDNAVKNFKEAAALEPGNIRYRLLYTDALIKSGKIQEAGKTLQILRADKPANPLVDFKTAYWEQQYGNPRQAIEIYTDLQQRFPDWSAVLVNLSEAYAAVNDNRQAEIFAEKALTKTPEWAPALVCAGRRALTGRSLLKAENCFSRALVFEPGNTEAKTLLAQVRHDLSVKPKKNDKR